MSSSPRLPSRSFGSVAVAMVTPFHEDGSIDVDAGVAVATKLVDDGCDAVVVHGTTGESSTTHQPEKDELMRAVVDAVGERAMIIGGAGSNDTAHAVRIAQGAQRCGAQGLLVVSPYYNRPSQEGVYQHVVAVADSVDLPVMLYDIPGRTGVAFADETLDRLAQHPRILAVKDATGNVPAGFERMARTGLEYYSGDDALNFDWLAHGASGVVSVVGHVATGRYAEMVREVDAGDLPGAREVAARMRPVVAALMGNGQGAVMSKHALHLQGVIPSATVRLPLVAAPDDDIDNLAAVLREHGLLESERSSLGVSP
ncbi:4-hydroxy-tetrahydrodipicolinate synthase [Georgenia halophila]